MFFTSIQAIFPSQISHLYAKPAHFFGLSLSENSHESSFVLANLDYAIKQLPFLDAHELMCAPKRQHIYAAVTEIYANIGSKSLPLETDPLALHIREKNPYLIHADKMNRFRLHVKKQTKNWLLFSESAIMQKKLMLLLNCFPRYSFIYNS